MGKCRVNTEQPKLTKLNIIHHPKGDIYHALKCSEPEFQHFGEAYFTSIKPKEIKGWKRHKSMQMNLVVPYGDVRFHLYDGNQEKYQSYRINQKNYSRLTVPSGYWMAFEGMSDETSLILNIASIEHDPHDSVELPLEALHIHA